MLAIFLDIETTGLDTTKHCAIDIAFKVINDSTGELKGLYQSLIRPSPEYWEKRDLTSMEINGYTWEQLEYAKEPQAVRQDILDLLSQLHIQRGNAVFICQNSTFDRAFFAQLIDVYTQEKLNWPYHWLDLASMYWALEVQKCVKVHGSLPHNRSLSKNDIARQYNLPSEAIPHRAINGVEHLIMCYEAVLGIRFLPEVSLIDSHVVSLEYKSY